MSSVMRTMRILELLSEHPRGLRITDLADRLAVNRAVPHRILADLIEVGYVVQDPETERYRCTFLLGGVGLRQLEAAGVTKWSRDEIERLAAQTKELVRVAIATVDRLCFVAQAQGADSSLTVESPLLADIPLHATATGKAFLSTLPDAHVVALLDARGLEPYTPGTRTGVDRLLDELSGIRRDGFAAVHEEFEVGISAMAAPIVPETSGDGRAVGTISIAGPSVRLTPERQVSLVPALRDAAASLGRHWNVYDYFTQGAGGAPTPAANSGRARAGR